MTVEKARAKINLCLDIKGKKDEMHLIDGVFVPIELCDDVVVEKNGLDRNRVFYEDGRTYDSDTALKTADLIKNFYQTESVDVFIKKRIPEKKGLGGSSADAGAVARCMEKLFALKEIDVNLLLKIGSDVPFAYVDESAKVSGLGEKIEIIDLPPFHVVVCVPNSDVNTGECYAEYDRIGGKGTGADEFIEKVKEGIFLCDNALYKSACSLNSDVLDGINELKKVGFSTVGMTGSGSALYAVEKDRESFENKVKNLEKAIEKKFTVYK